MTSFVKTAENGTKCPDFSALLNPVTVRHMVREWLKEDTPNFDYGGFVVGEKEEEAVLLQKSPGVLSGTPFVDAIFTELDCTVEWLVPEGKYIETVRTVAKVKGKVRRLLLGERVALNCITRCSGIASIARRLARLAKDQEWGGEVAGTRKTTPGFRLVEKYGLLVGGVSTHRFDQSSMIMLKDNHIWVAGNITQAVRDARVVEGFSTKIEVECRSLEEASEAAQAGAEVLMLDNFEPNAAKATAKVLKERFPSVIIESSGGITEESISQYFDGNIDVISLSKLTQGYETLDFSLKVLKDGRDPRNLLVKEMTD